MASQVSSDVDSIEHTFSSWDNCMSQAYCKWPVIVGIIIGVLILFSIISCLVRCLCCGVECCCGCLSCCNACCPSPRGSRRRPRYDPQPPPNPYQSSPAFPAYQQYQAPQQPPVYASGGAGYRSAPSTATFDVGRTQQKSPRYHEDALPAMPSWDAAPSRQVEDNDVELDHLSTSHAAAHETLLPTSPSEHYAPARDPYYDPTRGNAEGDLGAMSARPYHDYSQHQQFAPSPYGSQHTSNAPLTYNYAPPSYPSYGAQQGPQHYQGSETSYDAYDASVPPPSYRTGPPSVAPTPSQYSRRPVPGTWRDV